MAAPELTYADVMILILWLILSFLLVWLISIVSINAHRFRLPARMRRWIKKHKKPCRAALMAANQSILEENMILRQSNDCLMKENIRLRKLLSGVE